MALILSSLHRLICTFFPRDLPKVVFKGPQAASLLHAQHFTKVVTVYAPGSQEAAGTSWFRGRPFSLLHLLSLSGVPASQPRPEKRRNCAIAGGGGFRRIKKPSAPTVAGAPSPLPAPATWPSTSGLLRAPRAPLQPLQPPRVSDPSGPFLGD